MKSHVEEERYALDGQNVWADLTPGGSVKVRYFRGDESDQLFGRQNVREQGRPTLWYLTDRQQSGPKKVAGTDSTYRDPE